MLGKRVCLQGKWFITGASPPSTTQTSGLAAHTSKALLCVGVDVHGTSRGDSLQLGHIHSAPIGDGMCFAWEEQWETQARWYIHGGTIGAQHGLMQSSLCTTEYQPLTICIAAWKLRKPGKMCAGRGPVVHRLQWVLHRPSTNAVHVPRLG